MWTDPGNIQIAHRHINVEIGNKAAQFPEKKYVNGIFITVWKAARVIRIRSCLMIMVRIRIFLKFALVDLFSNFKQQLGQKDTSTCTQGCEWNERSLNRGPESRPRLGSDVNFFWDSCSNLEIDENVQISHNLGLGLAAKISQAFAIQLIRYRDQYTPSPNSPPLQNLRNCEILGP